LSVYPPQNSGAVCSFSDTASSAFGDTNARRSNPHFDCFISPRLAAAAYLPAYLLANSRHLQITIKNSLELMFLFLFSEQFSASFLVSSVKTWRWASPHKMIMILSLLLSRDRLLNHTFNLHPPCIEQKCNMIFFCSARSARRFAGSTYRTSSTQLETTLSHRSS
jgi:hypothetical protein